MDLHEQWLVHCSKLDDVAKTVALQEAAATAGRTTRRSLATMGDAVRSDLEMEQIIASLGTEEMTDANILGAKNAAVIPDMIVMEAGEIEYTFDDTNNEVDRPAEYYSPATCIEDWTDEEVEVFVEKFAEFPKQFGIIADFLPHKTTAQCVSFYYLHKHKHIDFRKVVARRARGVKRKRGGRKHKSNGLLSDIRQRDDEVSSTGRRRRGADFLPIPEPRKTSTRRAAIQFENTPTATPTPEPEGEPRKRRRRAVVRASVTGQEDGNDDQVCHCVRVSMGNFLTVVIQEAEPKPKRSRKSRKPRQLSVTPASTPTIADEMYSRSSHADDRSGLQTNDSIWQDADIGG